MNSINKQKLFNKKDRLVVALDGPSASGKGHIGREIANQFALKYFESSRVYRGLAYLGLQHKVSENDIGAIISLSKDNILELCEGVDLFQENIAQLTSKISVIPQVRKNLTEGLQKIISENNRIIMEGRDIASIVAPDADIKIFITADVKTRAERRCKQLLQDGKSADLDRILADLIARDKRDSERKVAPLIATKEAIIVDTTRLAPAQVLDYILDNI